MEADGIPRPLLACRVSIEPAPRQHRLGGHKVSLKPPVVQSIGIPASCKYALLGSCILARQALNTASASLLLLLLLQFTQQLLLLIFWQLAEPAAADTANGTSDRIGGQGIHQSLLHQSIAPIHCNTAPHVPDDMALHSKKAIHPPTPSPTRHYIKAKQLCASCSYRAVSPRLTVAAGGHPLLLAPSYMWCRPTLGQPPRGTHSNTDLSPMSSLTGWLYFLAANTAPAAHTPASKAACT